MDNKYLDYEGLQRYHQKLVDKLVNLNYDPPRMFTDKTDLMTVSNWYNNPYAYGEIQGIKEGMLITVGYELWQLTNMTKFKSEFTIVDDKSSKSAEDLGWKIISRSFNVNEHLLNLK